MTLQIMKNQVIEWPDEKQNELRYRVVWISPTRQQVRLFPLLKVKGEKRDTILFDVAEIESALEDNEAVVCPTDPHSRVFGPGELEKLPLIYLQKRDRAWGFIKDLVDNEPDIYIPQKRGRLIAFIRKKHGVAFKTVKGWLDNYWERGMTPNALLPDYHKSGGRGSLKTPGNVKLGRPPKTLHHPDAQPGVNVTEADKKLFQTAYKRFYENKKKVSLKRAYDQMCNHYYIAGYETSANGVKIPIPLPPEETPTFPQFKYHVKQFRDLERTTRKRKGDKNFEANHRALPHNSTCDTFGPGSAYQIDATEADLNLVNSLDRSRIIGRPTIYFLVDVFSRMICGFYVCIRKPSWAAAMMALANAVRDKVEFCKQYGVEILRENWPASGSPRYVVGDQGEMKSKNSDQFVEFANASMKNAPTYRPELKGLVEQMFNQANIRVIHEQEGAVTKDENEPGSKDSRLNSVLTISEFTQMLLHMVMEHNNTNFMENYPMHPDLIRDKVQPIPVELWEWGIENRSGELKSRTMREIVVGLLPRTTATVTRAGIKCAGQYYTCREAEEENWYVVAGQEGSRKVEAAYYPEHLDNILILHGEELIECQLMKKSQAHSGQTIEEREDYEKLKSEQKKGHEHTRRQYKASTDAHIKAIEKDAIKETTAALEVAGDLSKAQRLRDIAAARRDETKREIEDVAALIFTQKEKGKGEVSIDESVSSLEQDMENDLLSLLGEVNPIEGDR